MKASDLPLYYNAVDILERNLATRADKVALLSAERELTFKQVSDEANQVGNALKKLGVRMGDGVAILSLDCPEWVTSFFGILKIGAASVGINTLLKPHELQYIFRDARARVLIVHQSLLPSIEPIRAQMEFVEHVIVIGDEPSPAQRERAGVGVSVGTAVELPSHQCGELPSQQKVPTPAQFETPRRSRSV